MGRKHLNGRMNGVVEWIRTRQGYMDSEWERHEQVCVVGSGSEVPSSPTAKNENHNFHSVPKVSWRTSPWRGPTDLQDHLQGCRRVTDPHVHTAGLSQQRFDFFLSGMVS